MKLKIVTLGILLAGLLSLGYASQELTGMNRTKILPALSESTEGEGNSEVSFTEIFTVGHPLKLELGTMGGSIAALGSTDDHATISFIVKERGQLLNVNRQGLGALADVEIIQTGNRLAVVVKKMHQRHISISFVAHVPIQSSCVLNTSGGSISMENLEGIHQVATSGGSLKFSGISGNLTASTAGGSIGLLNCEGDIDAKTSGGSIKMQNVSGMIDVSTSGGSIKLDQCAGRIKASTAGGSIKAYVSELYEELSLHTSGGSINATIPSGLGLDLNLEGGSVNTSITNFTGEYKKNRVVGSCQGGGIKVEMKTSGGNVNLNFN